MRGDSGFCRQRLIRWCERRHVGYVIGVARNTRLHWVVAVWEAELEAAFAATGTKQRTIHTRLLKIKRRDPAQHPRRVRIMLASHHLLRATLFSAAQALVP